MEMLGEYLYILMFLVAIGGLLSGYPVAPTLGGVALIFAGLGMWLDVFPEAFLRLFPSRILGVMQNQVLMAVPLFVLMGVILERSRLAEDLLDTAGRLLGGIRGGLGFAVILVGALLAASTGIVGATVITMSLIALPSMLKQNYSPSLSSGSIAAAGTLGQIIPPSIVLILLADVISNANAQAKGTQADPVSVGDLFSGALLPGLFLVGLYLSYIAITAWLNPKAAPPRSTEQIAADKENAPSTIRMTFSLVAPLILIIAVLGSILGGLASPTEAAALGAIGAILLAGARMEFDKPSNFKLRLIGLGALSLISVLIMNSFVDLRLGRDEIPAMDMAFVMLSYALLTVFAIALLISISVIAKGEQLMPALKSVAEITAMVFFILICAALFSIVFRGLGGDEAVEAFLQAVPGGMAGALAITMIVMFLLGFFLDFIEITYVVVPLVAPPLILMGADPVWLGVLMAINLQTSFLTPPFGFALFYLRGAAPKELATIDIWKGALPFVGLQLFALAVVIFYSPLATYLPSLVK